MPTFPENNHRKVRLINMIQMLLSRLLLPRKAGLSFFIRLVEHNNIYYLPLYLTVNASEWVKEAIRHPRRRKEKSFVIINNGAITFQ